MSISNRDLYRALLECNRQERPPKVQENLHTLLPVGIEGSDGVIIERARVILRRRKEEIQGTWAQVLRMLPPSRG